MPNKTIDNFADKIKQRKEFKNVKDKKKSAKKQVEKKWKEAEDIVKKQYGSPDDVPKGKFYGTLMIILKNKLHLKESKFEKLYQMLTESPDALYKVPNAITFIYWKDEDTFNQDMNKFNIDPEGFIEEEKIKFPLLMWIKNKTLMFNKKKYGKIERTDHNFLFNKILDDRRGYNNVKGFDGRDWGNNSGRLNEKLISFWGNSAPKDMIKFIIDTVDMNFQDTLNIETAKKNVKNRRYLKIGDVTEYDNKKGTVNKLTSTNQSPIDAVRNRRWPGMKFENKIKKYMK